MLNYPKNGEYFYYLREYEGSLISKNGNIWFTNNNYEERLLRDISDNNYYSLHEQLQQGTEQITTDAGTFDCVYSKRYSKNINEDILPGIAKFHYKEGVGLIQSTMTYVNSPFPIYKRSLVSYNIQ